MGDLNCQGIQNMRDVIQGFGLSLGTTE